MNRLLLLLILFARGAAAAEILSLNSNDALRKLPQRQLIAAARPEFRTMEDEGFLRFDGKDDFLHLPGPGKSSAELTLFVLAAPRSNAGFFRGLFATAPSGANDYIGGLNLDLGPNSTTNLSIVNVESAGSSGFADLLQPGWVQSGQHPFGGFHVFTLRTKPGEKGTELFIDGMLTGSRNRTESKIGMDDFIIGARLYSNDGNVQPFVQGSFDGDIAPSFCTTPRCPTRSEPQLKMLSSRGRLVLTPSPPAPPAMPWKRCQIHPSCKCWPPASLCTNSP